MNRIMLKSKIHRATVTATDLGYEGSISVPSALMEAADIINFEQVHIYNITNGNRLVTYCIPNCPGEIGITVNGAAAHLVKTGDLIIIASYAEYEATYKLRASHTPTIIKVDGNNIIIKK